MGDVLGDPDHQRKTDGQRESDDAAMPFPAQLRRLRVQRGLSLADLARQTHYSKGYLSKIETGSKRVTVDVARRCDDVLRAGGELVRMVREGPRGADGNGDGDGLGDTGARAGAQADGECPYRGLPAFTAREAPWFFGRARATAELIERVFERIGDGPLMLLAPSGAGKSSLLNAGFVPALREGGFPMPGSDTWPVLRFTPTAHPLAELLDCAAKALGADHGVTVGEVRDRPHALLEAVRRHSGGPPADGPDRTPPPPRPVLLVDQFEELFTLCSDEDERRAFVRVLCALAAARREPDAEHRGDPGPAVVVLGVRADFSGNCLDLPELAPVFTRGLFVLPPMSLAELRESITRPADLAGLVLEPGLFPLLMRDAGLRDDQPDRTPSGVLPLVSHALLATWRQREGATLTVDGYERTGGIQGAIARTAEEVFTRLYPAEQNTLRRVLVRLVHVADGTGATRRRMSRTALMEQLAEAGPASAALDAFVRARLITMDRDTVEITHEALLHAWPRLRGWIRADRAGLLVHQQLAHAAAEWEREGRDPSALHRGTRLESARAWADEHDGRSRLGPLEAAFLRASQDAQDGREQQAGRQVRLRQWTLATLVVLLVLAVGAGGLAYQQRAGALGQERVARSRALALQSAALAAGRPEASMLLAARAYRTSATSEARGALLSTQSQPFTARLGGHGGPVNAVAFGPGNGMLATAGSDGRVMLRRVADRRTIATFTLPGRVRAVAFSPDGSMLAATSTDGPARLWDTAGRGAGRRSRRVRRAPGQLPSRRTGGAWPSPGPTGRSGCGTQPGSTTPSRPSPATRGG